ncbi:hypothetical protein [Oceanobacter kriegii]|uniref:hypothetical protein n=1 Tax=Oceanobacter kriegii TaxID=64972 RepID=UPI00041BFC38|nr:hypothetical protein [Oceanobacter kriegii]
MDKFKASPLVLAIALGLTACGGGSSSSSNDSGSEGGDGETTQVSLTGLAVKGILVNATVRATSLDGSTEYGITTTNAEGRYSLEGMTNIPANAPIKVTMTTNSATQVKCDSATGCTWNGNSYTFGQFYPYNNTDFELTAVLPSFGSDTAKSLMVTPVTHLAAKRIESAGYTSSSQVASANNATATLLGLDNIDITNSVPADITESTAGAASAEEQLYGAIVASIATIASGRNQDVATVIEALADDYANDGGLTANSSSDDVIDLEEIFESAEETVEVAETTTGSDLGATQAVLEQEATEAEAEEPDTETVVVVDEDDEEMTQALAAEQAIDLLLELNEWEAALNNDSVQTLGDAFVDQAEALEVLAPTFEEQSDLIRGFNELVISSEVETECWTTEEYNDTTGSYETVEYCEEYEETRQGILFDATNLMLESVALASKVQNNHDELVNNQLVTMNDDGAYEFYVTSVWDMNGDGYIDEGTTTEGSIKDMITADDGTEEILGDFMITYTVDDSGLIDSANFMGTSNVDSEEPDLHISGGNLLLTLTAEDGGETAIDYALTSYQISSSDGLVFSGGASANMAFTDQASRDVFLSNMAGDVSLADTVSISAGLNGTLTGVASDTTDADFSQATAMIDSELLVTRVADSGATSITMAVNVDVTNSTEDYIKGEFAAELTGEHSEASDAAGYYIQTLEPTSLMTSFSGQTKLTNDAGATVVFDGQISQTTTEFEGEDSEPANPTTAFYGNLAVTEADSSAISFEGSASLQMGVLKDADGMPVYFEDELYLVTEMVKLESGTLNVSTAEVADAGTVALSATLTMDYGLLAEQISGNYQSLPDDEDAASLELMAHSFSKDYTITDVPDGSYDVLFPGSLASEITLLGDLLTEAGYSGVSYDFTPGAAVENNAVNYLFGECFSEGSDDPELAPWVCYLTINGDEGYTLYPESTDLTTEEWVALALETYPLNMEAYSTIQVTTDQGSFTLESNLYLSSEEVLASESDILAEVWVYDQTPVDSPLESIEQTEDSYLKMSAVLNIESSVVTLDDARIRLVVNRLGLDDASGSLLLEYGERSVTLRMNSLNGFTSTTGNKLTISNGTTTMNITASCESGDTETALAECESGVELGGTIKSSGFEVGTLEVRDGIPVFVFDDGSEYNLVVTPEFLVSAAN